MRMSRETYDSKNYADALEYAKQVLRLNPESLEAKLLQASILMAQKDYGTAKQTLRSIIGTDPENIEAYGDLIAIFEMEGDKDSIKNLWMTVKAKPYEQAMLIISATVLHFSG